MRMFKRILNHVKLKAKITFALLLIGGLSSFTFAQNEAVRGVVADAENGEPVIGAIVSVEGTQIGVLTDIDGVYKIPKLDAGTHTLSITYIGYQKMTKKITVVSGGETITADFRLIATTQLTEVVVTALGIKRDEKALGYSISKLGTEDITNAMPSNWSDALSGKIAGVNLVKSGGGPGGSNKIVLRGENSLSGTNQALIIVDGVILNSASGQMTNIGGQAYNAGGGDNTVDFGSSLGDINPDDIESMSVLKGPGAAALYGSKGANGAIIITTKSGLKQKGMGIAINSNTSFEMVNRWPDYQYEYGQGTGGANYYSYNQSADGASTRSTSGAWGPKFNESLSFYQYDPTTQTRGEFRTPWVPYKNNRKDFFKAGITTTNSVSLQTSTANSSFRFSYTNSHNDWILENTGYNRNSFNLSAMHKITDKLKADAKVIYTYKTSDNLPEVGYGRSSVMYYVRGLVPNADNAWMKDYWRMDENGERQVHTAINRPFSSLIDNPYAILNEMLNSQNRNHIIGNISLTYDIISGLSALVRGTIDHSSDVREQTRPFDTQNYREGRYRHQTVNSTEVNMDFLLTYNLKPKDSKFSLNASVGGARLDNKYETSSFDAQNLVAPNNFNLANSKSTISKNYRSGFATNSLYALLALNYDFLYMDATSRTEWHSRLASPISSKDVSLYYPSVNLSAIITEAVELPKEIDFLKARASIAIVGGSGDTPYATYGYYTDRTPEGFKGGLSNPASIPNKDLKPERTTSYEIGIDGRFLDNRLSFDLALYLNNTKDQIIKANVDRSTGFSSVMMNAGEVRNKGIEFQLNGDIIRGGSQGFNLSAFMTYTINRNKLVNLGGNLDVYNIYSSARGNLVAYPGGSLGAMYGLGYRRAPEGSYIDNGDGTHTDISGQIEYDENGYARLTDEEIYIGDVNPKWKGSFGLNAKYKNFSFSAMLDGQFGGIGYSLTHAVLMEEGKLKKTLPGRYSGIVGDGVKFVRTQADPNDPNKTINIYEKNTVVATDLQEYYKSHYDRSNVESNTFKTDYIKLRELRLDYTVPKNILTKLKLQSLVVGLYGRDLFTITKWPAFDPEIGELSGSNIVAGFETAQFPSTVSFGTNIKISF